MPQPPDDLRARLDDGTEIEVQRLTPTQERRVRQEVGEWRKLPQEALRNIEWKSFAAGAGAVLVTGAAALLGTLLFKRSTKHAKRRNGRYLGRGGANLERRR